MSGSLFIGFSNAFVFPDPEHETVNIRYGWSESSDHFALYVFMSSFVISVKHYGVVFVILDSFVILNSCFINPIKF